VLSRSKAVISDLRCAHNLHIQSEPLLPSDANKQTTQNTRGAVCACTRGIFPFNIMFFLLTRLQTVNSFNGSWELLQKIPAKRNFNNRRQSSIKNIPLHLDSQFIDRFSKDIARDSRDCTANSDLLWKNRSLQTAVLCLLKYH